jgi:hypothetical protein
MFIIEDIYEKLLDCCRQFSNQFTTDDIIKMFVTKYPIDWDVLQRKFGAGGKGNGRYFTPYVYIGQMLRRTSKKNNIRFEGFKKAPEDWGNSVIANWSNL